MKKLFALLFMAGTILTISSCSDDEMIDLAAPVITPPAATSVQIGETITLDFTVAAEAGYASANATATGGAATITAQPEEGDDTGTITVSFVAGNTAGGASVTVTVFDNEGDTDDATVVVTLSESPVPSLSGIPVTAEVTAGEKFGPVPAAINMDDVPGTLTITKNGEPFGSAIDITADDQVVDFEYTPSIEESNTNVTFVFTATDSDGDQASVTHVLSVEAPEVETIVVTENISENTTWETGKIYELAGRITVLSGVTLTIQPGVVTKGQPGTGSNSSALLIARGAILDAQGTPESPIIMTSTSDDLIPGQIQSPNLDPVRNGEWGGLIILGNAPISVAGDASQAQIEGIPGTDTNGLYGGDNPSDNSGTIAYVSVRHGGTLIGANNEINGITLGGVGSGTSISNVEVVGNQDDGIEWFGGNVDVTNALIWNSGDDGLDTDQDWIGTCDNFIIVSPAGHAFELDGPEGTLNRGVHTFINGTVYVGDVNELIVDWDDNTNAELQDVYFFGWSESYMEGIASYGGDGAGTNSGWQYTLTSGGGTAAEVFNDVPSDILSEVSLNQNAVGADATVFSWTWASKSGALSNVGIE